MNLLEVVKKAALAAKDALKDKIGKGRIVGNGALSDETYDIDLLVEDAAINELKSLSAIIISEEKGILELADNPEFLIIMDPLDGSKNVARNLPIASFSIAIYNFSESFNLDKALLAYVYDFLRNCEYYSINGKSYKDAHKIKCSNTSTLDKATISCYYPFISCKSRRCLGSVALELCLVADGTLDGLICCENKLRIVDFAAGYKILKNAGGVVRVRTNNNKPIDPFNLSQRYNIIATNPKISNEIAAEVSKFYNSRTFL